MTFLLFEKSRCSLEKLLFVEKGASGVFLLQGLIR